MDDPTRKLFGPYERTATTIGFIDKPGPELSVSKTYPTVQFLFDTYLIHDGRAIYQIRWTTTAKLLPDGTVSKDYDVEFGKPVTETPALLTGPFIEGHVLGRTGRFVYTNPLKRPGKK
jgi:hypothetical protein